MKNNILLICFFLYAVSCNSVESKNIDSKSKINSSSIEKLDGVANVEVSYINMKDAFIKEDKTTLDAAIHNFVDATKIINFNNSITGEHKSEIESYINKLNSLAINMTNKKDMQSMRSIFKDMAEPMKSLLKLENKMQLYVQHCPMAFNDSGASWISKDGEDKIRNPFFPKTMLQCGEVTDTLPIIK